MYKIKIKMSKSESESTQVIGEETKRLSEINWNVSYA